MAKRLESEGSETSSADIESIFNKDKVPTYKVILLGETGSGKTSLFMRYKHGTFQKGSTLNTADRFQKEFVNDDGEKARMVLWDTAGMERMGSLTFHYYHGAHAVLLVFALDDKTTFDQLSCWNDDVQKYSPKEVKRFLVATKNDIDDDKVDVTTQTINAFCKNKNITGNYSISAKTGDGVDDMFHRVVKTLRESVNPQTENEDVWLFPFQPKPKKKQSKCGC